MKSAAARTLQKSKTLEGIGGAKTLWKFRKGEFGGGALLPHRARAALLARICGEIGDGPLAKSMAKVAARAYLSYDKNELAPWAEESIGASYTLAKKSALEGGLSEAEFAEIAAGSIKVHVREGRMHLAIPMAVEAGMPKLIEPFITSSLRRFEAMGMRDIVEKIKTTFGRFLSGESRETNPAGVVELIRAGGEAERKRIAAGNLARHHAMRRDIKAAWETANAAGLDYREIRKGAKEMAEDLKIEIEAARRTGRYNMPAGKFSAAS